MKYLILFLVLITALPIFSQNDDDENQHWTPTHNFTVIRLIILNDKDEMLISREDHVSAPQALVFKNRQFLLESLDSLSASYGIKLTKPQMHGYFSFKYEYHPYATMRAYFVARYKSGTLKIPPVDDDAQWMPIPEAIDKITVPAIQKITRQIINNPNTVWGGSFMVSRDGNDHPTKMIEPFYPLFHAQ